MPFCCAVEGPEEEGGMWAPSQEAQLGFPGIHRPEEQPVPEGGQKPTDLEPVESGLIFRRYWNFHQVGKVTMPLTSTHTPDPLEPEG